MSPALRELIKLMARLALARQRQPRQNERRETPNA